MRVVVDLNRCQGYAQCVFLAPEVFELHGEEALLYDLNPDDAERLRVLRAAAACPVQAIAVERLDGAERRDGMTSAGCRCSGRGVRRSGRIVIVGASLAGLRAAEALREEGFRGRLTIIGDEPYEPYDRPPLSKQVLHGLGACRPHRRCRACGRSTPSGGSGWRRPGWIGPPGRCCWPTASRSGTTAC